MCYYWCVSVQLEHFVKAYNEKMADNSKEDNTTIITNEDDLNINLEINNKTINKAESDEKIIVEINNPCDEPIIISSNKNDTIKNCNVVTQEDAVDQFLSGALKNNFNDSMPSNIKNRIVDFKSDNTIDFIDNDDEEDVNNDEDDDGDVSKKIRPKRKYNVALWLKKRSVKM